MIQARFKDPDYTNFINLRIEGWFPVEFSEWPIRFMRLCPPYTEEWLVNWRFTERALINVKLLEFKK